MCTRGVMFSAGGLPDCLWFMGWKCKPPALDPEELRCRVSLLMMGGERIDLQLTQRLFTNRRELNQTLFKFIDFEFKYVLLDTTKIRKREKEIVWSACWLGVGLLL